MFSYGGFSYKLLFTTFPDVIIHIGISLFICMPVFLFVFERRLLIIIFVFCQ